MNPIFFKSWCKNQLRKQKFNFQKTCSMKCKSVIQTIYDIAKAHGGELKLETSGEGTCLIVRFPV
jgi:hypothetical protein